MKICLLSNSDGRGGGYAAAYRLHRGLLQKGMESTMIVGDRTREDPSVLSPTTKIEKGWSKVVPTLDSLLLPTRVKKEKLSYSLQWIPDRLISRIEPLSPDVINLHWINAGFVRIETLAKLNRPLVWTLHDMWAFTGGCHYSGDCDRYEKSCGACPQLNSHRERDISRWVWWRKAKAWKNLDLTIVTPSRWLADLARQSSLFQNSRIEVIANGLDLQQYKPIDKNLARNLLGLPTDKRIILFGAIGATSDRRKGFHLLLPALQKLGRSEIWQDKIELVVFGASEPVDNHDFGFKTHYLGKLNDDISLALVYAAADIFVAPSLQENLPNTILESLACGTPCVAFKIGGMPDSIDHQQNGYLARPYEIEDLFRGIHWVLEDNGRYEQLCHQARKKAERQFSLDLQARKYSELYRSLLHPE